MPAKDAKYYIGLVIAMFFWGGSWVSAKILVAIAPPFTIGFFRFLIGSILFIAFVVATGTSIRDLFSRSNLKLLFLIGFTGVFGYGVLFLFGMQFTTAAQGSIIAGFNPVTISLFAHLIHKERLKQKWQYSGFMLSFIGVIFVVGIQALLDFQLEYLIGNLIILGAMVTWGLYASVGKEAMKKLSPAEVNAGGAVLGCVLFGLTALVEEPWNLPVLINIEFWYHIFYLGGLVTFIGFLFFFMGIKNIGATRTGGFVNLVPVFGTLLSVFILQETIYWTFIVGLALVILGVSIINYPTSRSNAKSENEGS
ncbi:MAG: DMT family transporter [Candidatus Thorarchaeota archaeon]|jgi:drug/metabolite transporter (DMT)-like permease